MFAINLSKSYYLHYMYVYFEEVKWQQELTYSRETSYTLLVLLDDQV